MFGRMRFRVVIISKALSLTPPLTPQPTPKLTLITFVVASVVQEQQIELFLGTMKEPRQLKIIMPCPLLPTSPAERFPRQEMSIPISAVNGGPGEDLTARALGRAFVCIY